MKYAPAALLAVLFASLLVLPPARAQEAPARSPKKAFALSLLVPGLGHRYAHGGDWDGAATAYALADAGLWLGLVGTNVRQGQVESDYESLAATSAGAQLAGKDRRFFLNLATFQSSDEFLEVSLRNRAWDQVAFVADRANQWRWETEADFLAFRGMREDAETLRRRGTLLVGLLVANRLVSGFTALRAASRANREAPDLTLTLVPPPVGAGRTPMLHLDLRF
jgi:hypothetical protein